MKGKKGKAVKRQVAEDVEIDGELDVTADTLEASDGGEGIAEDEEAAATQIQKMFRGMQGRKSAKGMKMRQGAPPTEKLEDLGGHEEEKSIKKKKLKKAGSKTKLREPAPHNQKAQNAATEETARRGSSKMPPVPSHFVHDWHSEPVGKSLYKKGSKKDLSYLKPDTDRGHNPFFVKPEEAPATGPPPPKPAVPSHHYKDWHPAPAKSAGKYAASRAAERAHELDRIEKEKALALRQVVHLGSPRLVFSGAVQPRHRGADLTFASKHASQGTRDERIMCLRMWPTNCEGKAPSLPIDGREFPVR